MSDQPRALPDQPSLRYLKVEAKRRLSAGEFGAHFPIEPVNARLVRPIA